LRRQRQTHEASIRRDDRLDGQRHAQGEQRRLREVSELAQLRYHLHADDEELEVLHLDVGGLTVEQRQLGCLHYVGADVALHGLHEQEHLNVAEEGQAHCQTAETGDTGIAAERRNGLRIGQLRDGDVQVARQRAGRRQTRQEVASRELVDDARNLEVARGQLRLSLDGTAAFVEDVHVKVDADTLEEVLGDADELDLDGH